MFLIGRNVRGDENDPMERGGINPDEADTAVGMSFANEKTWGLTYIEVTLHTAEIACSSKWERRQSVWR